jgi:geranylgeranyl reductase family protein
MMEKYDIVIIGAGPAGASAAKILEEKGHKYLIVDKEVFPRNKPCAGVLSPKIKTVIKIPEELHERPLEGYRIFSPSNTMVESIFPQQGSIVERDVFDAFLVKSLRKQPTHIKVKSISDKGNCVEIKSDNWRCETSCVIGADGVNSIVKNYYNIPSKSIAKSAQYIVALPKEAIDNRVGNWFEVYYTLQYGYGWISPMNDCLKIGVGIVSDHLKGSIWQILDKFMTHPTVNEKIKGSKIIRKEAHTIPMSGPLDRLTGNRAILVGDAGGFVYPGTGEGIYYAIKTGRIAAQVVDHAIAKQKFNEDFLEKTYLDELEKNGLLGLRDVDFVERYLTNTVNAEKYVKRLKYMTKIHPSS